MTNKRLSFKALSLMVVLAVFISTFCVALPASAAARGAWAANTAYAVNDTVTYSGSTYTCIQAHTSLVGWEPSNVPALWKKGGSGTTPPPTTPPATNGVTFYADINYGGTAKTLGVGNYTLSQLNAAGIQNDWMSSLRVPSGYKVEVYQNDNFTGTKWTYTADSSWVGTDVNDQMTSVKVLAAVFYADINYGGTAVALQPGSYTMTQLNAKGIPNDWMSSLKIPSGWTVEVYQNDNLTGTKWTFTASSSSVGSAVNDQMTSVKIYIGSPVSTFITTCVKDDLNNEDMYIFDREISGLGYKKVLEDTNVTKQNLINYVQRSDVTTVYHTGHGNEGLVATADGYVTYDTMTLNAQNTIFATCLTLVPSQWRSKFGPSAQSLLGYTKVSYDWTDNAVARDLVGALKNGNNYMKSWYLANASQSSLSDRWCGYVREGSNIVEYSARNYTVPNSTTSTTMQLVSKNGKVKVADNLLKAGKIFDTKFKHVKIHDFNMNKVGGKEKKKSVFFDTGDKFLNYVDASAEKAQAIADNWLQTQNLMQQDAKLDAVTPVQAVLTSGSASKIVGYIVRYTRDIDGLSLRATGKEDFISVLVNGDTVVSCSKEWSDISGVDSSFSDTKDLLSVSDAIKIAGESISQLVKAESFEIIDAKPCYGKVQDKVVPAYELISPDGTGIIINAITAEII